MDILEVLSKLGGWTFTIVTTLNIDGASAVSPQLNYILPAVQQYTEDVLVLPHFVRECDRARFLHYLIRSRGADVVFMSNTYAGYVHLPYLQPRLPGVAFVDFVHMRESWKPEIYRFGFGGNAELGGGMARLSVEASPYTDVTMFASHDELQWSLKQQGHIAPLAKHTVVHAGSRMAGQGLKSSAEQKQERDLAREKLGLADDQVAVLFSGRLVAQKQPLMMIRVFHKFLNMLQSATPTTTTTTRKARLIIAGDGELRDQLKAYVKENRIEDAVLFLGKISRDRMQSVLHAADIMLMTSGMEGIPIAMIEAMSVGVVCVSTDVGGISELVNSGSNGFLHPKGDRVGLAKSLLKLATQPKVRMTMSLLSRQWAAKHFSMASLQRGVAAALDVAMVRASARTRSNDMPDGVLEELFEEPVKQLDFMARVSCSEGGGYGILSAYFGRLKLGVGIQSRKLFWGPRTNRTNSTNGLPPPPTRYPNSTNNGTYKPPPGQSCCKAMTAPCQSCIADTTVAAWCSKSSANRGVVGCFYFPKKSKCHSDPALALCKVCALYNDVKTFVKQVVPTIISTDNKATIAFNYYCTGESNTVVETKPTGVCKTDPAVSEADSTKGMCKLCTAFPARVSFAKELTWQDDLYTKEDAFRAFDYYCYAGAAPPASVCCKALTLACLSQCAGMTGDEYCKKNPASRVCPQTVPATCTKTDKACLAKVSVDALGKLADIFANPNNPNKRTTKTEVAEDIKNLNADTIKKLLADNPYANIGKGNANALLNKLKEDNGDFSQWSADQLRGASKVITGLSVEDISKINDAAIFGSTDANGKKTEGTLGTFGKVRDFSKKQASTLAKKFLNQLPGGIEKAGKDMLKEAGTILEGLVGADIKKIAVSAWSGAKDAFKEVCKKKGALSKDQIDAIKERIKKDIPKLEDASPADVEASGGLIGTLDEADLMKLPESVIEKLVPEAISVMGAAKCSRAFSAARLAKLTAAARNRINGNDFNEFTDKTTRKEQIKALVGRVGKKIGAFVDFALKHDTYETADDLVANIKAIIDDKLAAKQNTEGFQSTVVVDSLVTADDSVATRRLTVVAVRRLTGGGNGDFESVVRVETSTNAGANDVRNLPSVDIARVFHDTERKGTRVGVHQTHLMLT